MLDKQKWLERGRDIDKEIRALHHAKERAYSDATRITSFMDSVRSAKGRAPLSGGRHADALARVYEFEEMIENRILALYTVKHEIHTEIDKITDPRYRTLLIHRYINLSNWERIAIEMNYSYDYVKKELHSAALNAFAFPQRRKSAGLHYAAITSVSDSLRAHMD